MAQLASSQNLPSTNKQQSSHETICLETHTWHVKRFHMIDKWGYKIPYYSNKSLTAGYKAITENCLLQDISYYTCIQIVGEKNWLEATLKEHCNPSKTFAEKVYTYGEKEGMVMFFKRYGYPEFPIGNVNFFWKPSDTNIKTIWIWVHPAFYSDFLSEIISSFEFKQNNAEQDKTDISHNLNDLYTNDAGCEMLVLKYALNRFRLSGPASLTVLKEVLHVPSLTELDLDSKYCSMTGERDRSLNDEKLDTTSTSNNVYVQPVQKMVFDENGKDTKDLTIHDLRKIMWHTKYYKERANIEAFKIQEQMWQSLKVLKTSPFLLSNIIGLTVLDPRFHLSVRNTKTEIHSSTENIRCHLSSDLNHSPIWDAQIRNIVNNSCVSTNTGNKLRRESLVPDMSDDPYFNNNAVTKIPILLIQKPAVVTSGFRIDIIIPSGWAMAFWMALIMRSPLVGGLRETKLEVFENLTTCVPDINDPDTPAYMREALTRKEELINEYFSHSPIQRVNFIEFGIRSPFFCDWKNLTKGWSDVENFYVLRNLRLLAFLRMKIKTVECKNVKTKSTVKESEFNLQDLQIAYKNCLVQVKLSMLNEGTPKNFAIICIPKRKDLRRFENNKNYEPIEKCHTDENKMLREILCRIHWMQLEPLSRHEIERKRNLQDNVLPEEFDVFQDEINGAKLPKHRIMLSDHAKKVRKLYLPESTEVRHSCDREVMGYVTMGGFSFFRAKNIGVGYVTLPSLLKIICEKSNIVLVRNIKELQYRLARLDVLVDIIDRYL